MFNENKLNGNQVAFLFGATCFAASAATGLVLRALTHKPKKYFHGTNENLRGDIKTVNFI